MPSDEEIQAVIDVLFNMGSLRYAYELRMLDEAYKFSSVPRIAIHFGRLPKRLSTGWSKRQFDEDFREPVRIALEQAARIRKERKKAIDIYPVNANAVSLGAGKWALSFIWVLPVPTSLKDLTVPTKPTVGSDRKHKHTWSRRASRKAQKS